VESTGLAPRPLSTLIAFGWRHELSAPSNAWLPPRVVHKAVCSRLLWLIMAIIAVEDLSILIWIVPAAVASTTVAITATVATPTSVIPAISTVASPAILIISHGRKLLKLTLLLLVLVFIIIVLIAALILLHFAFEHRQAALKRTVARWSLPILAASASLAILGVIVAGWAPIGHLPLVLLKVSLHLVHLQGVEILPI